MISSKYFVQSQEQVLYETKQILCEWTELLVMGMAGTSGTMMKSEVATKTKTKSEQKCKPLLLQWYWCNNLWPRYLANFSAT